MRGVSCRGAERPGDTAAAMGLHAYIKQLELSVWTYGRVLYFVVADETEVTANLHNGDYMGLQLTLSIA